MIAGERYKLIEETAELNQPVPFKVVLTSEWKPQYVLNWGRGWALVSKGNKNNGFLRG